MNNKRIAIILLGVVLMGEIMHKFHNNSIKCKLSKLKELHKADLLTDDEYAIRKDAVLNELL